MSAYMMIRRLYWPAVLLLIGVLALLHQSGVVGYFWRLFWPLLLILTGGIQLAERAALAAESHPVHPGSPYQGNAYQGADPANTQAVPSEDAAKAESALVSKRHQGFENDVNGGQQ